MKTIRYFILVWVTLSAMPNQSVTGGPVGPPPDMVRIPAGHYTPFITSALHPAEVNLKAFYLDVAAVTNRQFLAFVKQNPSWARSRVSPLFADGNYLKGWASDYAVGDPQILNSPVTDVSWFAAQAYCKWVGKRLPTLDEWEYAASALPTGADRGTRLTTLILEWYSHPNPRVLPPVKSTYRNQYGLYDMHGLVWEWVYDFNSVLPDRGGEGNNLFCAAGSQLTADKEDYAAFMRFAFRESLKGAYTVANLGFRCAQDVPAGH